ncbi:MAG: CNNM domain-containing protein [Planctomycetaceae bacterium]
MFDEVFQTMALWLPGVGVMLALTILSGFFSASETALFSLSRNDLQAFLEGSVLERRIVALLGDSSRLLTAILFWNLVTNLSYFAVSVVVARRLALAGYPEGSWMIGALGLVSIILLGEVLPKSLSVVFPRRISLFVVWPLALSVTVLDRVIPPLLMITRGLKRGFWPRLEQEVFLEAEDLEKAVDLSSQSSEMIQHERKVLHQILDLKETTVEELMRPRGTYITVTEPVVWRDLGRSLPPGGFAAVVEPGTDQVCGVYWLTGTIYNPKKGLRSFRETVVYVPWCAHAARALSMMREKLCHTAVVVDEYGQTIGMLSQQDLLDSIFTVSTTPTRLIHTRDTLLKIGDETYHLDGLTTLRFLAQHLNLPYDPEAEPSVTVAGLLHQLLRRFPEVGDQCVWQGWRMRVFDVSGPSRIRVLLERDRENSTSQGRTP